MSERQHPPCDLLGCMGLSARRCRTSHGRQTFAIGEERSDRFIESRC
jgi:hypothetical protein